MKIRILVKSVDCMKQKMLFYKKWGDYHMKKFKKIFFLLLTMTFLVPSNVKADSDFDNVQSPVAVIMDASNKRVLYSKNGDDKHYPASMTKVMTMLLAIEKGDLKQELTMSEEATLTLEYGSTHISLQPGEVITLEQAIYASSLASANDACNGIAEGISGSQKAFAQMMNERAKQMGCTNTHFANPHGLHDDDHYTTAIDMAKIMSEACQNPEFIRLTSAPEYTIPETNKTDEPRYLYNPQLCLDPESEYYIKEVLAAKSGYTEQANFTYVAYAKKGNVQLVICLMDVDSRETIYQDLQVMFEKAFDTYQSYDNFNQEIRCPKIPHAFYQIGGKTELASNFALPAYTANEKKNFDVKFEFNEDIKDKKPGEVVGKAQLYYDDTLLTTRDLLLTTNVQSIFSVFLSWILTIAKWLILIIVLAICLLVAAKKIYTQYKRNQRRKKRRS